MTDHSETKLPSRVPIPQGGRGIAERPRPRRSVPLVGKRGKRRSDKRGSPDPRPRGCWATCAVFAGASFFVLTLVVAVMGLALTLQLTDFLGHPVDNFLAIFGFDNDATPQVVDSRTLVLELKELAVLETAQSGILITKTIVDSSAAPDAELQVSYVGTVKAGIDLAAIAPEDIVVADGVVSIKLPPPAITYCDLGKPEVHVWECRGWAGLQDCGSRYTRLQSEAYDRALDELLETALELGLNELAQEHAQQVLYDLLVQLGFEQVQFETQEAVTTPDVSCLPRDS